MLTNSAKPFVKWAGGKRHLLSEILKYVPKEFDRYLEPFVGGGAVCLALNHHPMLLNDANVELINSFEMVRDKLNELIICLNEHQSAHSEEYYYKIRKQNPVDLSQVERAGRFIYLNKTAYNGLYRVNRLGQFNVPFGKYRKPTIYDLENMQAVSRVLKDSKLFSLDYCDFLEFVVQRDFIYIDPPYQPISKYSDFKRYTKNQFRENDQYKLALLFSELIKAGAYPVLSNSYSELTLELYANYNIHVVEAPRNINNDGNGRGKIREILVTPKL